MIVVDRYPNSRFWSVAEDGVLLAVTTYKRGAIATALRLAELTGAPVQIRSGRNRGTYLFDSGRLCSAA